MILNKESYIIFDGAMGTMLQKYDLNPGQPPEVLNITRPEIIEEIHRQYIKAGSTIVTTNTFGAIETKLNGTGYSVEEVVQSAVAIARKAADKNLVALDMGPTGELVEPLGDLSFEEVYDLYSRQIKAATLTGNVDLILIETFFDLTEAHAAIRAAKDHSSLPVICTFTFQQKGKTLMGKDVKTVVASLEEYGVDAVGVNCSLGPSEMLPIVETMVSSTQLPILVQPNAGLPKLIENRTVYDVEPEEFARYIQAMASLGVKWFGGCCGTTPEFIRAIKESLDL
ncbi:homocysteine S-methyltransferase family protein [Desulfitobacterium chlororespirans]|uniref:5-methyltetrahydrofolate--homocysteine methyltransferase n=1 Tax=Desulfitobacterium chlororespirans DSM 11544 TaxID=1121395 RepID=A0A1M7RS17_9FIRM|nr:homocysteine S-methyltransferase family protein [Desulfitobacterium chlororespirans]SHN49001.1 5-methyltetrahydrofolate--homocysteine methyltransferase [Desulfitobacterium chlororespirans DSM 11544]